MASIHYEDMKNVTIHAEVLSAGAFASFGTVVSAQLRTEPQACDAPHTQTATTINQGTAIKISPVSPLINAYPDGAAEIVMSMVCSSSQRAISALPPIPGQPELYEVSILERHCFTTQTFIPLSASHEAAYLVVVAPATAAENPPNLPAARAFLASPSQAITYKPGIWHAPIIVLSARGSSNISQQNIDFIVTQFVDGTSRDCQEIPTNECIPRGRQILVRI